MVNLTGQTDSLEKHLDSLLDDIPAPSPQLIYVIFVSMGSKQLPPIKELESPNMDAIFGCYITSVKTQEFLALFSNIAALCCIVVVCFSQPLISIL